MTDSAQIAGQSGRKPYQKPNLQFGPMLSSITAVSPPGSIVKCWVAQAAFGRGDVRWLAFREWLMSEAPSWFRDAYVRHGEFVGSWLQNKPVARAIVRTMMMPAAQSKLRD